MPKLDPTISLGNVLSMATMVIGIGGGVVFLENRLTKMEGRIENLEASRVDAMAAAAARETRIRNLEVGTAGMASDLRSMQGALVRIEAGVDELRKERRAAN